MDSAEERELEEEINQHVIQAFKGKVKALEEEVKTLKTKVASLQKYKEKHKDGSKKQPKEYAPASNSKMDKDEGLSMTNLKNFLNQYGGLSRYTIVSDEWHAMHPKAANVLLGFSSWEECKQAVRQQFPGMKLDTPRLIRSKDSEGFKIVKETSFFEQAIAVKLMDRIGMTSTRCAVLFKTHDRTVTKWRQKWCHGWNITQVQVFHSTPMIGPSRNTKRRLPPPSAAAASPGPAPLTDDEVVARTMAKHRKIMAQAKKSKDDALPPVPQPPVDDRPVAAVAAAVLEEYALLQRQEETQQQQQQQHQQHLHERQQLEQQQPHHHQQDAQLSHHLQHHAPTPAPSLPAASFAS